MTRVARDRSVQSARSSRRARALGCICALLLTAASASAAQAAGPPSQSAPLASGSQAAVVAPARSFTAILLGSSQLGWVSESALEAQYALWGRNVHVQPAFRGLTPNPNDPTMLGWERHGYRYVWTVASSDYATAGEPLYVCTANQPTCRGTLDSVLSRPGCIGLFMHEVVSDLAAGNGWGTGLRPVNLSTGRRLPCMRPRRAATERS